MSTLPPDDNPYRALAGDESSEAERRERDERLVDAIFAPNGTHERTHDSDCFACDLAAEIAGSIAASVHFGTRGQQSESCEKNAAFSG